MGADVGVGAHARRQVLPDRVGRARLVGLGAPLEGQSGSRVHGPVGADVRGRAQLAQGALGEHGHDRQGLHEGGEPGAEHPTARPLGPGAQAALEDQEPRAGEQTHLEEVPAAEPLPEDGLAMLQGTPGNLVRMLAHEIHPFPPERFVCPKVSPGASGILEVAVSRRPRSTAHAQTREARRTRACSYAGRGSARAAVRRLGLATRRPPRPGRARTAPPSPWAGAAATTPGPRRTGRRRR